jgi:hypothetical protein
MQNNTNLAIHNLVTIGAKNSVVLPEGAHMAASDNLAVNAHPSWSQVAVVFPIQNSVDAMACRDVNGWPATPPNGKFRNADFNDNRRFFVTMVNGSPYRFTLTRKNSYQMTEFNFADIDPGFTPQNSMYSGLGTFVDTNGEAVSSRFPSQPSKLSLDKARADLLHDSTTGWRARARRSRSTARPTTRTRRTR